MLGFISRPIRNTDAFLTKYAVKRFISENGGRSQKGRLKAIKRKNKIYKPRREKRSRKRFWLKGYSEGTLVFILIRARLVRTVLRFGKTLYNDHLCDLFSERVNSSFEKHIHIRK